MIHPHRLELQNPAVMEGSKLHFLPSPELAVKFPGPDSQIFTAGNVQSRRTTVRFFRYEVKFAAFVVIKLWL